MSDSESEATGWRNTDQNRVSPSPVREPLKRLNNKDLSSGPDPKKIRKGDIVVEERILSRTNNDETANVLTQPPMLLFKHFLNQQEDDILIEDAMRKYSEYKEAFACQQLQSFFETHKDEEWFMEKYHPDYIEATEKARLLSIETRRRVFMELYEDNWLDQVSVHVSHQDSLGKLLDAVCILLEGGNKNDLKSLEKTTTRSDSPERVDIKMSVKSVATALTRHDFGNSSAEDSDVECIDDNRHKKAAVPEAVPSKEDVVMETVPALKTEVPEQAEDSAVVEAGDEPRPLHRTLSVFLRNIHVNVFRSQIEELVRPFPGFMRLALQDAMPERKFLRRGWATFAPTANIADVAWQLSRSRLQDVDLGAVVNRPLRQRVRPVSPVANHRAVMRQDVKYAAKMTARLDARLPWPAGGEGNPLLRNITEHLVDEGSYEEEALLGGDLTRDLAITGGGDPDDIRVEEDRELAAVLDRLVLYLRVVHSYDYYQATEYLLEDQLPSKCGLMHARGCLRHPDQRFRQSQIEAHMRASAARTDLVLDSLEKLGTAVAARLGAHAADEAVARFLADNTREISAEKWLCPLSGKKFKGPDFVHKHILNKYPDRVAHVRQTVDYFNNYVRDARRPQLPEHASNRPAGRDGAVASRPPRAVLNYRDCQ